MVLTVLARLGAIGASVFLVATAITGCGPDLTRADGQLTLQISGIDAEVTELWIQVSVPEGGTPYVATPPISGSSLTHVIQTVPAGSASVQIQGRAGAEVEQQWAATVTIAADRDNEVAAPLTEGDDGAPRRTSGPFEVDVGPLTGADVVGGRLVGRISVPSAPIAAFLEQARAELAVSALSRIDLASAQVARLPGSRDVEDVEEAWRGVLQLTASPGPLAEATVPEDAPTVALVPAALDATALWRGAATTPVTLTLEGPARRDATDEFAAALRLTFTLTAR